MRLKINSLRTVTFNHQSGILHELCCSGTDFQEVLKECESSLDAIAGVTPVHAAYYKAASSLHKIEGSHAKFYADALKYLGCVDMDTLDNKVVQMGSRNAFG